MARYVGLDAHSKSRVYVIQDENGTIVSEGSVPTTPEGLQLMRTRGARCQGGSRSAGAAGSNSREAGG